VNRADVTFGSTAAEDAAFSTPQSFPLEVS